MSEWISVNKPPKDENKRVLVALNKQAINAGYPNMDTDRFVNGRWVRWNGRVTHWQQLPNPPVVVAENATASKEG